MILGARKGFRANPETTFFLASGAVAILCVISLFPIPFIIALLVRSAPLLRGATDAADIVGPDMLVRLPVTIVVSLTASLFLIGSFVVARRSRKQGKAFPWASLRTRCLVATCVLLAHVAVRAIQRPTILLSPYLWLLGTAVPAGLLAWFAAVQARKATLSLADAASLDAPAPTDALREEVP
jgi:hypothetical protein